MFLFFILLGAILDIKCTLGKTAVQIAREKGHTETVKLLSDGGDRKYPQQNCQLVL